MTTKQFVKEVRVYFIWQKKIFIHDSRTVVDDINTDVISICFTHIFYLIKYFIVL